MNPLNLNDVVSYVEANIGDFHKRKADNLKKLKLKTVLQRKNPYLFKAKNILTAQDLIKGLLDAHLSSQEEAIFGEFLEGLAIFVCNKVFNGQKSSAEGIDLEFEREKIHYIVSIKSGPNWGNSRQIDKMIEDFKRARKVLRTNNPNLKVVAVNGCCYGKQNIVKDDYYKYCGQKFWEFISGSIELYKEIIEPLGYRAKEKNDEFNQEYARIINIFTQEFMNDFCISGVIDWNRLVEYNSGINEYKSNPKK